mgnify:CR=1 FL=1
MAKKHGKQGDGGSNGGDGAIGRPGESGGSTEPTIEAPDRSILPIHALERPTTTTLEASGEAAQEKMRPLRPPPGAPNVLVILLDDVGFGAPSPFGGPCHMPNAERLAEGGLKYTRFHTTALCSPTRQALLTGRNHHSVNMGGITEMAT